MKPRESKAPRNIRGAPLKHPSEADYATRFWASTLALLPIGIWRGFLVSGDLAHEVDMQETVLEARALRLDEIGELERALKGARHSGPRAQSMHLVGARRIMTLLLWASYKRPAIVNKSESRLRMFATHARDAALTVPTAAMSASFDLSIMVLLPLIERSGHNARVVRGVWQISSVSGIFNRRIFEWTVHAGETIECDVPENIGRIESQRAIKAQELKTN